MNIRLDSMLYRDHQSVLDGTFSAIPTARMYEYPHTPQGEWGQSDKPDVQAERVVAWWDAHPDLGRWVYSMGFAQPILDCGAIYGNGIKYGPSAEQVVQDFERDEVDIHRLSNTGRGDLSWIEQFITALDVKPTMVHLDPEWYYSYWEFTSGASERQRVLSLLAQSKRALSRFPDNVARAIVGGKWNYQAILDFNRHGARLTGSAIRRIFTAAGYDGPIAAFGYWNGSETVKDPNGWPIALPTPDQQSGCYGAYDDNEPGAIGRIVSENNQRDKIPPHTVPAFTAALVARGLENPASQFPVLRAFDDPQYLAVSVANARALGCTDLLIWTDTSTTRESIVRQNLTTLATLLRS